MFTLLKHTNENTRIKCSSCYQFPFQKSHRDLNSNPWISRCCMCGNMQASWFDLARVKIALLASLLILSTFVFSSLWSPIWKGKSLSTDAVKVYNKCKKDITLLIVLISSEYFEQNQRLLSKETEVPHQWGSETSFHLEQTTKSTLRKWALCQNE